MTLAAAAAIAAAAAVSVVSAAFAIYAVLVPLVTPAGAAAIVAAVAALIVAVAGMIAARKVEGHRSHQAPPPAGFDMTSKVVEIVRDRPIMSIGIGLAAGLFALKNPTLTAAVAKAFLDPKPPQR
ncbi:membrane protein implicated in regulation of membrane protease activity [Caulobacter sp. 1776]